MQSKEITELQKAIEATHGCQSRWEGSVRIEERFEGKTAWSGIVELFALIDYPEAKYAYAWIYRAGDQNKTIVVLKVSRFAADCRQSCDCGKR